MFVFLRIHGIVSQKSCKKVLSVMNRDLINPYRILLFADYSDFEVPIGTKFTLLKKMDAADTSYFIDGELTMATQQFAKPFDCIPKGWKTIIEMHFDTTSFDLVKSKIRVIDSWDTNTFLMCTNSRTQHDRSDENNRSLQG